MNECEIEKIEIDCYECDGCGYENVICKSCNGSGDGLRDGTWCRICNGDGEVSQLCKKCQGAGTTEQPIRMFNDDDCKFFIKNSIIGLRKIAIELKTLELSVIKTTNTRLFKNGEKQMHRLTSEEIKTMAKLLKQHMANGKPSSLFFSERPRICDADKMLIMNSHIDMLRK